MNRNPSDSTSNPATRGDAAPLTSIKVQRTKLPAKSAKKDDDSAKPRVPSASVQSSGSPAPTAPAIGTPEKVVAPTKPDPGAAPAALTPPTVAALPPPPPRAPLPTLPTTALPLAIALPAAPVTPSPIAKAEPSIKPPVAAREPAPELARPPVALVAIGPAPRDGAPATQPKPQPKPQPRLELVAETAAPRDIAPQPKPKPEPAAESAPRQAMPMPQPQAQPRPEAAAAPVPRVPKAFGRPAPASPRVTPRGDREFVLYWDGLRRGTAMPKLALLDRDFVAGCWPDSLMVSYAGGGAEAPHIARLSRTTGEIEYTPMVTEWIMACAREVARRGEALEDVQEFPLADGAADYHLLLLPFATPDGKSEHVLCHLSRA